MKSRIFEIVIVTILITRLFLIALFYALDKGSLITQTIVYDSWHHYHFGLVIITFSVLFSRLKRAKTLLAIGLGIFLEEWAVILNDLGLKTLYLYNSQTDLIVIVGMVCIFYIFNKIVRIKE